MEITIFLRGVIIGFAMAAPIGPVNMLCMQRTLERGRMAGITSGLGAAAADAFYAGIAGFGLTLFSRFLLLYSRWIRIIGGIFICFLGVRALLRRPSEQAFTAQQTSPFGTFSSTLFLTLTNPTTIFTYGLMFAAFGVADIRHTFRTASFLVLGVFTGSTLWWIVLGTIFGKIRMGLSTEGMHWIIRISGIFIAGFGLFVLFSAL